MRKTINLFIVAIFLIIAIGILTVYFRQSGSPIESQILVAKYIYGKQGNMLGEFFNPNGLAIKDNYLYVADSGNARIQVLQIQPDGNLLPKFTFGRKGKELGEFKGNYNLAIRHDYLYISERANARIQVLQIQPNGNLLPEFTFGKEGKELGEFSQFSSFSLAIKDNYLYVADSGNARIQVLQIQPDGNLLPEFTFGKEGKELGEFGRYSDSFIGNIPSLFSLAIKDNYLYVVDSGNARIQVLQIQPDGNLLPEFTFGREGKELGEFQFPLGLAIKDNYLYVADSGNARIQVLQIQPDGNLLPEFTFGKEGKELGEFGGIQKLAIKDNYIFVSDSFNNNIQILEIKY